MAENPGTKQTEKLLSRVDDTSYVIPHFQRGFEWQPSMVCDLVESMLQNYYAGLILLWELDREEAQKGRWDPLWGVEAKKTTPVSAILDGQQRLASLYYAIYNPKKQFAHRESYYVFFLNLTKVLKEDYEDSVDYKYYSTYQSWERLRENRDQWAKTGKVPLSILSAKDPEKPNQEYIDSTEFSAWLDEYVKRNQEALPEHLSNLVVYKVFRHILSYNFVFYPLSSGRKLPDICNIFARVNAKGMKLSTFDLMNAFLFPKGIELRKDLWDNLDNELLRDIDPSMNEYLLKLISLVKQNYCSSKYLYNLIPEQKTTRKDEHGKKHEEVLVKDGEEFKNLWKESCKYAEKARKIIMNTGYTDFGAIKTGFIPNTTIVPVLGAVLWHYDKHNANDAEFQRNLKKWYWAAVLSEEYSGSSDTVMAKDFRDWKGWIDSGKNIEGIKRINQQAIVEMDLKNSPKGSARYNAILCILALNNAKDFLKGQIVGTGDYSKESIHDHHIFPKQVRGLNPEKSKTFGELKDSIVNRTLLLDETNKSIGNKKPSQYIQELVDKYNGNVQRVKLLFEEHFINEKAFEYMKDDDFDNFVLEREKTLKHHIISKLEMGNQSQEASTS